MAYTQYIKVSGVWEKTTIDWTEVLGGPTNLSDLTDDYTPSANVTIASGDRMVIADATDNNYLKGAIAFTGGSTNFLREDGTFAAPAGSGGGGLSIVWAEENNSLNTGANGGFQFSFGNGATSSYGCTIPFDCDVIALGISSNSTTTGTVELYVNGAATGKTVSLSASDNAYSSITDEAITAGDRITFRTTSGSGGGQVVVSAVLASEGIVGPEGPAGSVGLVWKGSWVIGNPYDENDCVEFAGSTYIATADTSGTTDPDQSSDWDLFVAKGTDGDGAITKEDVEAVLTGEISTHTHPADAVGAKQYASYYLTTGGATNLGSTATTMVINNTGIESDGDNFGLASNEVTVSMDGVFKIDANVYLNNSSSSRVEYSLWLEQNDTEIPGSRFVSYQRGYDSGMTSSGSVIVTVTSGDTFRIRCQLTDGNTTSGYQDNDGTRLTFVEV